MASLWQRWCISKNMSNLISLESTQLVYATLSHVAYRGRTHTLLSSPKKEEEERMKEK